MFTKQLKYDFAFSAKVFIGMFLGLLGLTVILRLTGMIPDHNNINLDYTMFGMSIVIIGGVIVAVASYFQIWQFFRRNFFGPEGYLMLTLPVKRGKLLASKFIVTQVWFNFMLAVVPIILLILAPPRGDFWEAVERVVTFQIVDGIININLVAFVLVSILFLTITLTNTVIFNKKIHGAVAGAFAFAYHWAFFWVYNQIQTRFFEIRTFSSEAMTTEEMRAVLTGELVVQNMNTSVWMMNVPQVGWRYGRIPVAALDSQYWEGYIDIWQYGFALAFAAVTIAIILYLLKKHVALR